MAKAGKDATWSPNGEWIAFVKEPRYDAYSGEEIWIVRPTGDSPRNLADGGFPQWSANSTRVFYHSRKDDKVYAVRVDEPNSSPVIFYDKSPPSSMYPAISPDETKLAFGRGGGLTIVERKTGNELLSFPARGSRGLLPAWSPDGALFAYGGFNSDQLGIWVLEVSSKKSRRVVTWIASPYSVKAFKTPSAPTVNSSHSAVPVCRSALAGIQADSLPADW